MKPAKRAAPAKKLGPSATDQRWADVESKDLMHQARLPTQVKPVSADLLPDFLAFFDGEAFADNPQWGFCYCQFSYVDHSKIEWKQRRADENRNAACRGITRSSMTGYLAFRDDKPVGWCNAAPRAMLVAFDSEPDPDAPVIGQITCFVVAEKHRRTGVASALLHAACDGFRSQGLQIIEATANPNAKTDAECHYGPLGMYLGAGFHEHSKDDDGYVTVRLRLQEPPSAG